MISRITILAFAGCMATVGHAAADNLGDAAHEMTAAAQDLSDRLNSADTDAATAENAQSLADAAAQLEDKVTSADAAVAPDVTVLQSAVESLRQRLAGEQALKSDQEVGQSWLQVQAANARLGFAASARDERGPGNNGPGNGGPHNPGNGNGGPHNPGNGGPHNPGNGNGGPHNPGNGGPHNPGNGNGGPHNPGNGGPHNPGNGGPHNPGNGGPHNPGNGGPHNPGPGPHPGPGPGPHPGPGPGPGPFPPPFDACYGMAGYYSGICHMTTNGNGTSTVAFSVTSQNGQCWASNSALFRPALLSVGNGSAYASVAGNPGGVAISNTTLTVYGAGGFVIKGFNYAGNFWFNCSP